MWDKEAVKEVSVVVTGLVRAFEVDGGISYDWVSDNDESEDWFATAEDAELDFQNHF